MYKILTLNNISVAGLERFPRDRYEIASEIPNPDAILLRSAAMHEMDVPASLKAVGRAGAGVNNIPVVKLSAMGIPVFNAPGANANAVKELVLTGMLLAARNVCQAWSYANGLQGDDQDIHRAVEAGKKQYVGFELPGRVLGVIGLGAVGVQVANAALVLGMKVIGYDPDISVKRAWQMSSQVQQAMSVDDLLVRSDFVTFHVPLIDTTRHLINIDRLQIMKTGVVVLNFARHGIVDDEAMVAALDSGKVYAYVCDFPTNLLKTHPRAITLPHLGASTREAEDNSAVMVADQVRDFLEQGSVANSVNFPDVMMPCNGGYRLSVVNENVPNMLGQISTKLANAGLNIVDMINRSNGNLAYTLVDVETEIPPTAVDEIASIHGVLNVRMLGRCN